jgi:hypothetical protein
MISMRERKLFPSFCPGSCFPGGRGPRRKGAKACGVSLGFPGNVGKESGGGGSKIQKPLRGDAEIICTEGRKFSKSRPPKGPSAVGLQRHHREWPRPGSVVELRFFFGSQNRWVLVRIVSVAGPQERLRDWSRRASVGTREEVFETCPSSAQREQPGRPRTWRKPGVIGGLARPRCPGSRGWPRRTGRSRTVPSLSATIVLRVLASQALRASSGRETCFLRQRNTRIVQ